MLMAALVSLYNLTDSLDKSPILWYLILAIFDLQWVMPVLIKDALISWRGAFVGKKRKKAWKAASLCLFWTLWKERIKELLRNLN